MKTILVIGASGYLGSNVINHFKHKYKMIAGFHRRVIKYPGVSAVTYSLSDRNYMKRLLSLVKPDIILYCAGINDLQECHKRPKNAEVVNSFGPVVLAAAADTLVHRFVYLSSAYVYDGSKGNFVEGDVVLPESNFGKTKLAGENYVRSKCMVFSILRLSPIFGIGNIYRPSVFDWIRIKLERGERVSLPQDEVHSFVSLDIVLKSLEWIFSTEGKNRTYNLGGLTKVSWFEFGRSFAECLGFDPDLVIPSKSLFEGKMDFSLNGSDLVRQLEINPLVLEESLDLFKQKLIG